MLSMLFLIAGFVFLIKGGIFLVDGSASLARKFRISDLVIGLTVVSFGTSSPELLINIIASLKGSSDIAIGNIVGSNIVNILLILGIASLIYPLKITQNTVSKEIPLSLLAALLVFVLANDRFIDQHEFSQITRIDGIVLISFFIIFIFYTFSIAKENNVFQEFEHKQYSISKSVILIVIGLVALVGGGELVVNNALKLAAKFNLSEGLVGLTIIAIGTSLPELVTSVVAVLKKNADIAVGNILGSNIFNVFFILGISSAIKPLDFDVRNNIDVGIAMIASLLLFVFMFTGRKKCVDRWEGAVFLILYIAYIIFLINRG